EQFIVDCTTIAKNFYTTCGSYTTAVSNITATTGVNVSCSAGFNSTTCPGTMYGSTCVFAHKLCVTCSGSSTVRIRVQSNGLPLFCPFTPSILNEQDIDFEVNFNPTVSVNSLNQNATTTAALSQLLCNIQTEANAPTSANLVSYGTQLTTVAGVSVDGVALMNVNSANDVDPFYPTGGNPTESVDACFGHPNDHYVYHYHIASGCALNPPSGTIASCTGTPSCSSSVATYSISLYNSYRTLTVIGIAKDGHVVYGPYDSTGTQVTSGFDICNGMFYNSNGDYAYFATQTFPYMTGCFGPGNYPNVSVNCSSNAPSSYTKSKYAGHAVSTFSSETLVLVYTITFLMTMVTLKQ
ncbi:unnamed protein product, partial [Rotaria socialis]